jgi:hypothetical protein
MTSHKMNHYVICAILLLWHEVTRSNACCFLILLPSPFVVERLIRLRFTAMSRHDCDLVAKQIVGGNIGLCCILRYLDSYYVSSYV